MRVSRGPEREVHHGRVTVIEAATSTHSRAFPQLRSTNEFAAPRATLSDSAVSRRSSTSTAPWRETSEPQLGDLNHRRRLGPRLRSRNPRPRCIAHCS